MSSSVSFRITRTAEDLVQTITALSQRLVKLEQRQEALEFQFPMRVVRYAVRYGSGGAGHHRGGHGIIREMEFLAPARVTVISERRRFQPYGLHGGHPGESGENVLIRMGLEEMPLNSKSTFDVLPGDMLRIATPGGGGWGAMHGP